jgi:hypothetical protein
MGKIKNNGRDKPNLQGIIYVYGNVTAKPPV